jgi:hypothetical protein
MGFVHDDAELCRPRPRWGGKRVRPGSRWFRTTARRALAEQLGGVPLDNIRCDNLNRAVKQVLFGCSASFVGGGGVQRGCSVPIQ